MFAAIADQNNATITGNWTLICFRDFSNEKDDCRPAGYPKDQLTIQLVDDGYYGTISGFTTTNKVSGNYVIDNQRMEVSNFGGTKMGEQDWGSNLWSCFNASSSYQYQHDTLVIKYDNDTKALLFVSAE